MTPPQQHHHHWPSSLQLLLLLSSAHAFIPAHAPTAPVTAFFTSTTVISSLSSRSPLSLTSIPSARTPLPCLWQIRSDQQHTEDYFRFIEGKEVCSCARTERRDKEGRSKPLPRASAANLPIWSSLLKRASYPFSALLSRPLLLFIVRSLLQETSQTTALQSVHFRLSFSSFFLSILRPRRRLISPVSLSARASWVKH